MDNSSKLGTIGAVGAAIGAGAVFVILAWTFRPTLTGGIPGPAAGIDNGPEGRRQRAEGRRGG